MHLITVSVENATRRTRHEKSHKNQKVPQDETGGPNRPRKTGQRKRGNRLRRFFIWHVL